MTIIVFGGGRGGLQAKEHHPNSETQGWQHYVVGVLCWRRDWCTSQNRWHHEVGKVCGYIGATSQDVKTWSQMYLPNGQWPQAYFQSCSKMAKDNKVKVLEWPSQSPDLNPLETLWAELKTCVRTRRPTNLTQIYQRCQEEWAKIHPTSCGKLVEGYLKRLTQVNLKAMLPNTNWVYVNCWPTGDVMKNKSWNKSLLLFWHLTFLK
jgi:hypothetical protein